MTLGDLLEQLDNLDPEATLYAAVPWNSDSTAVAAVEGSDESDDALSSGLEYLLDVDAAIEVADVWSRWRDGVPPTNQELAAAVIHYARFDSYLAP